MLYRKAVLEHLNHPHCKIKSTWYVGYNSFDSNFSGTNLEKVHLVLHKQKPNIRIKMQGRGKKGIEFENGKLLFFPLPKLTYLDSSCARMRTRTCVYIHTVFYFYSETELLLVIDCLLHINNMLWTIFPSCHIAISFFFFFFYLYLSAQYFIIHCKFLKKHLKITFFIERHLSCIARFLYC